MASTSEHQKVYQNSQCVSRMGSLLDKLVNGPQALKLSQAGKRLGISSSQAKLIMKQFGRERSHKQSQLIDLSLKQNKPMKLGKQAFSLAEGIETRTDHIQLLEHIKLNNDQQQYEGRAQSQENTYHCSSSTVGKSEVPNCQLTQESPQVGTRANQDVLSNTNLTRLQRHVSDTGRESKIYQPAPMKALRIPAKYAELPEYFISIEALNILRKASHSQAYLTLSIYRFLLKKELVEVSKQIVKLEGHKQEIREKRKEELLALKEKKKTLTAHLGKVAEELLAKLL